MRYSEGAIGRIFVLRLEHGDKMPAAIEQFALEEKVSRGLCIMVGGIDTGGKIVVGPRERERMPVEPLFHMLEGVHEICAVGTIFPDGEGRPRLHMHAALGREGQTRTGCIRPGIEVWKLGEIILLEIKNNSAVRRRDPETGFDVVDP
ncbi:MAG: DNA-binding protein [Candidatus Abyssobacteria bacterium SURF_5]|uniref:DNA-binding protein n=1 Tax=Abyssobacteria bacterium (strain SURF_5) TaxID=2093360 RepID=A0A3A4NCW2_ABYX5|nr:MAG: DNA-binding protein [Candidatus Abyssubacteria bacterium SURF_5]